MRRAAPLACLAVTLLAIGSAAAQGVVELRRIVPGYVAVLPVSDVEGNRGTPSVSESGSRAVLSLPGECWPAPFGCDMHPGEDKTVITRVDGVRDLAGAKADFRKRWGFDIDEKMREFKLGPVLEERSYRGARVLRVSLSDLGYVPGGWVYYWFLDTPGPTALYINPSFGMKFDFTGARLEQRR